MARKDAQMTFTVVDNSSLVLKATDEQIEQALIAIGARVETHAKLPVAAGGYMPVDTGRLKNSITFALAGGNATTKRYKPDRKVENDKLTKPYSGTAPSDPGGKVRSVYVGTNVEYAEIVENGTSGRTARHYLRNAVANHMEEYKTLAEKALSGKG